MTAGLAHGTAFGHWRAGWHRHRSHGHEAARQNGEAAQNGSEGAKAMHKGMMLYTASPAKSGKITDARCLFSQRTGAEAGEYVVAVGREEIAIGWPGDARARRPAPAAQHLARAKPGLRIVLVGIGGKACERQEV
jgi:hypothetical protein